VIEYLDAWIDVVQAFVDDGGDITEVSRHN
jgi:hypothetical protein